METATLRIRGMTCGGCVASVERVLRGVDGVGRAEVSLANGEATVQFEPGRVKLTELEVAIEDAGYEVVR